MAQEEVTEETLTMLQAIRDAVALGKLEVDCVPTIPSFMRGPSGNTLRARVIRYTDETEEEWKSEKRNGGGHIYQTTKTHTGLSRGGNSKINNANMVSNLMLRYALEPKCYKWKPDLHFKRVILNSHEPTTA